MTAVSVILLVIVLLYAAVIVLACTGWLLLPPQAPVNTVPAPAALVVPFRNEENNLPDLLSDITAQELMPQAVLVNDGSDDNSVEQVSAYANVQLMHSPGAGKKQASAAGIQAAQHALIVFTDADCRLQPQHVLQYAQLYTATPFDFAYGPVVYHYTRPGLLQQMYSLDQLALNSVALGLGRLGLHTYCAGANMAGSRNSLLGAVPQLNQSVNLSGDDITYLQHAVQSGGRVMALTGKAYTVRTAGPQSLRAFLGQRLRWGQKTGGHASPGVKALAALVMLADIAVVWGVMLCFSEKYMVQGLAICVIKLCIDHLFLFLVARRLGSLKQLLVFMPAWLVNLLYTPCIAVLGLFANATWKGRKVRRK